MLRIQYTTFSPPCVPFGDNKEYGEYCDSDVLMSAKLAMTGAYLVFKQRAFLRLQLVISRRTPDLTVENPSY
ncbi:hypothetical protein GCM10007978_49860 [Shewanella hanedai]|nr:hypothetical protein GCM10007978_49860 [Shewanella hanedai]